MKNRAAFTLFIPGMFVVFILIVISTTIGYSNITITETFKIILNIFGDFFDGSKLPVNSELTILKIRLPRILGAAVTGMGLTLSGIIFQSLLRNPMAEPYVLGVSSGASVGAAISIVTGINITFIPLSYVTPLFAFAGAIAAAVIVIFIAGSVYNTSSIILYGVSLNFLFSALLTLIMTFNYSKINSLLFWTMGSFAAMDYTKIMILFLTVVISGVLSLHLSRELNLFTTGVSTAQTLGLNVKKYRLILLITASLLTGVIVSFTGIIGFTGLIIPHLTRLFTGSEHKKVIALSLPLGAAFMIICDTAARSLLENELPVGVVTSIIGAPLFIYLLKSRGRK